MAANRVNLIMNGINGHEVQSESLKPDQCQLAFIRDLFGIEYNSRVFLRNHVNNEPIPSDENGRFHVGPGTYTVVVSRIVNQPSGFGRTIGAGIMPLPNAQPMMVPRFGRPNVSFNAGSPPTGRLVVGRNIGFSGPMGRLHNEIAFEPFVTVYFRLGKWTDSGSIISKFPNRVCDVPVKLTAEIVKQVQPINQAVTEAVQRVPEWKDAAVAEYFVYFKCRSPLVNCEEIQRIEYWMKEGKKGNFFAMSSHPTYTSLSGDSDSDNECYAQARGKKRQRNNSQTKQYIKKITTTVKREIIGMKKEVLKESAIKELVATLEKRFMCGICNQMVSDQPALCLGCKQIVGCLACNNTWKEKEVIDDIGIVTKAAGTWTCPLCRREETRWSAGTGYCTILSFDFLGQVAKLVKLIGMDEDGGVSA